MSTSLENAKYVSLETFKKDGTGVKTPMWVAGHSGKLVIGTNGKTYKVKRIRNNPSVRVAVCNASGSQILGPWHNGKARVVDGAEAAAGEAALNEKYGILRRAMSFFGRLTGRDAVIIEVSVEP